MLDEIQPRAAPTTHDELDERSIRSNAKTMLYMGEAVDRSLKKTYRVKTSSKVGLKGSLSSSNIGVSKRNHGNANNGSFLAQKSMPQSIGSLEEDSSIITQSIANSLEPRFKYEGITFPLIQCDRFLTSCWRAFFENSTEPIHQKQFDACELALSIDMFPSAIAMLSRKITLEEIEEYCLQYQLTPNTCLSWVLFRDVCAGIFTPILQKAITEAGLPLRPSKSSSSMPGFDELHEGNPYMHAMLRKDIHPYSQMIRKQRFKSCVDVDLLNMPLAEDSIRSVELPTGRMLSREQVEAVRVPISMLHEAVVADAKKTGRMHREILQKQRLEKDKSATESDGHEQDNSLPAIQTTARKSPDGAHPVKDLPSYCQPLTKQRVYELTHQDQSYVHKWYRMKQNRDQRFEQLQNRKEKQQMMHVLKKTVINSDRMAFDAAYSATSLAIRTEREGMHWRNKHNEDLSSWRKSVYQNQERLKKEVQVRDLNRAMHVALGRVEDEKEQDRLEKIYFKPDSSIAKLSSDTSYHVDMPSEVLDRIKHAKRYSDYMAAKKQAEQLFERTISERIARYTQARSTAIAKASSAGGPVAINTLFGDMLFSPESTAPMTGLAATMSLAYSSAHSSDPFGGSSSLSPPGSPSFFNLSDSNNFLKELAEKEYLARKQHYGELEEIEHNDHHHNNTHSHHQYHHQHHHHLNHPLGSHEDDFSEGDNSWRTDPRVAHLN